jgi:hypothetical protein
MRSAAIGRLKSAVRDSLDRNEGERVQVARTV